MTASGSRTRDHATSESVVSGSTRAFAAEALFPVTALIVAAYLSRRFGPDGYGLITLAAVVVAWVEWAVAATFSRATVKYVREADDWRDVAATVVRAQLVLGCAAAVALVLLATPVAAMLGDARLATHLRVFAADIPLFLLARAHRDVLVGLGRYRARSLAGASRWIARLVLIVGAVQLGGGTVTVLIAMAAASGLELAVCRMHVRPTLRGGSRFPLSAMAGYLIPIGLHSIALRVFARADLVLLTSLGGSTADAGHYGAAQNLSLLAPLLGGSIGPIVLSSLTLLRAQGDRAGADALTRTTLERALLITVVMALVSGAAPGLIEWLYGVDFAPAAPVLRRLALGFGAHAAAGFGVVILIAGGAPRMCVLVGPVLMALAVTGHLIFIPRGGAEAAATVTATCGGLGLLLVLGLVWWRHRVLPRLSYVARVACLATLGYGALAAWSPTGWMAPGALLLAGVILVPAVLVLRLVAWADLRAAAASVVPGRGRPTDA